jgi:hypothetical protein
MVDDRLALSKKDARTLLYSVHVYHLLLRHREPLSNSASGFQNAVYIISGALLLSQATMCKFIYNAKNKILCASLQLEKTVL